MGLDGVSINQLSIIPNRNSAELSVNSFSLNNEIKTVDGLSDSQMVDPDKENEKQKYNLKKSFSRNNDNEINEEADEELEFEPTVKYDLSRTEKFVLRVNDETNEILIVEKATSNIIQRINADELSRFINFLPDSKGAIVNRKF